MSLEGRKTRQLRSNFEFNELLEVVAKLMLAVEFSNFALEKRLAILLAFNEFWQLVVLTRSVSLNLTAGHVLDGNHEEIHHGPSRRKCAC